MFVGKALFFKSDFLEKFKSTDFWVFWKYLEYTGSPSYNDNSEATAKTFGTN